MNSKIEKGLEKITKRTNLSSGLSHPNDKNAAKEMFLRLHLAGEILLAEEIASWAAAHGWQSADAGELGALGQQIGDGKKPLIKDGPWWKDDVLD